MAGPRVRTDLVEVYVFRRRGPTAAAVEFLQLRRAAATTLGGTWQPVMGHIEAGETATAAAKRELAEETGFAADAADPARRVLGMWQLESLNAFFMAGQDAVVLSPGFAVEVGLASEPRLDASHEAHRWVARDEAERRFLWPGQRQAIEQIVRDVLPADSPVASVLRVRG